jgi:hypothetical protein
MHGDDGWEYTEASGCPTFTKAAEEPGLVRIIGHLRATLDIGKDPADQGFKLGVQHGGIVPWRRRHG